MEKKQDNSTDISQIKELGKVLGSYYGNRAAAYTMLHQHVDTIDDCNVALNYDPIAIKIHVRRAKACVVGQLDEAIMSYHMALVHDPNDSSLFRERKDVQLIKEKYALAKHFFLEHENNSLAVSYQNKISPEIALSCVVNVSETCMEWREAWILRMEILLALGDVEDAHELSIELMSKKAISTSSYFIFVRAKCFCAMGNLDSALKNLRQVITRDPDNKQASLLLKSWLLLSKKRGRADSLYRARDYAGAIVSYTEVIELCSTSVAMSDSFKAKLYYSRAVCDANLRNHVGCIDDCTKAIELDDSYADAYIRRAESYLVLGEEHECKLAIDDLESAEALAQTRQEARTISERLRNARMQLKRAKQKDLYKVLGVTRDASETEIRKSYRKLALKYHPDRQKSHASDEEKQIAEAKFREINSAHEILSNTEDRRRYDSGVDFHDVDNPHARSGMYSDDDSDSDAVNLEDLMFELFMRQHFFGGGASHRSHGFSFF